MQFEYLRDNIEKDLSKLQLGILEKKDQVMIGVISLNSINFINRNCEIAAIIGETKYQNFKYFIESNKLILKHAFQTLNLQRIYGGTVIPEIQLLYCKMLGFKNEGISRKSVYKNGIYIDVYNIGILKEEYEFLNV